jgi:hypothetical protein
MYHDHQVTGEQQRRADNLDRKNIHEQASRLKSFNAAKFTRHLADQPGSCDTVGVRIARDCNPHRTPQHARGYVAESFAFARARSIERTMNSFASCASPQPTTLTHFVDSRSL